MPRQPRAAIQAGPEQLAPHTRPHPTRGQTKLCPWGQNYLLKSGRPERRPLTRGELQSFLDAADDHVERAAASRRKGWLAAFRDATLFKVVYGWGLRRREAAMLDVADFAPSPAAARHCANRSSICRGEIRPPRSVSHSAGQPAS